MVTLTLKSNVHKFAYFIMLSFLTKLSDLGIAWVFGSKVKGYHPQPDPPSHHQDPPKNFFTIYKQTQFLLDFETYWKSTCNTVWPTGSWQ